MECDSGISGHGPAPAKKRTRWLILIGAILLLAACGGDEKAPELAALPTRTPVPATLTPEASEVPAAALDVISLRGAVSDFLTAAGSAGTLDRIDLLDQYLFTPRADCFDSTWWPGIQPLELFGLNPVSLPLETWQTALDIFPEDQIVQQITDALADAAAYLPMDTPFRACVLPSPLFGLPEEQANGGVSASTMGERLLFLGCSAGDACLEPARIDAVFSYAFSYQIGVTGLVAVDTPLALHILYYGRADYALKQIYPGATRPWDNALSPEVEVELWSRLEPELGLTYGTYPGGRNVERYLYGPQDNNRFPRWGGVFIGAQIVRAYMAGHPNTSLPELMALPPGTLLADSHYDPALAAGSGAPVSTSIGDIEIISLRDTLTEFLEPAGAPPTGATLSATIADGLALCGAEEPPEALVNALIDTLGLSLDETTLTAWRAAAAAFPQDDLTAQAADVLSQAASQLPAGVPLRVCLIPAPPGNADGDTTRAALPRALPVDGGLVLLTCGGPDCLDFAAVEAARGFALAYQFRVSGIDPASMTLLDALIFAGRADDFALSLLPDAALPWTGAILPEDEAAIWADLQNQFATTQPFAAWESVLYDAQDELPRWAGITIADRIIAAYRAQYPQVAWRDTALFQPDKLLEFSGYAPGSSATPAP